MAAPFRVKALYEYSSTYEDELHFGVGQVITVIDAEDADWYTGEYVDDDGVKRDGIFPRNFVEKFEPTAPPRPVRTRTKKEPEAPAPSEQTEPPPPAPPPVEEHPPAPAREAKPEPAPEPAEEPLEKSPSVEEPPPAAAVPGPSQPAEPVAAPAPKPKAKPAAPPPVSEKPKSNAFKDRIAAFNRPDAAPIIPFKPSAGNFVKKPFVAPPPSRNAFVPPPREAPAPKVYRRDEDPEVKEQETENLGHAETAGLVPAETQDADAEDQPQPKSLKERIALLQKQQMEQAQRNAETAAKKEKPKRPPKKHSEPVAPAVPAAPVEAGDEEEDVQAPPPPPPLERRSTEDAGAGTSTDDGLPARAAPPPRRKSSKGPATETVHDGNEADMSGAGDTEGNDDTTEREEAEEPPHRIARAATGSIAAAQPETEEGEEGEEEEEEEDEEEDFDPEVKRKEELRARMAKMSGGMGFHGMFGGQGPPPGPPPPKKKKSTKQAAPTEEGEGEPAAASRAAPPIPTMMALPGLGGQRKSEDTERAPPPPVPPRGADEDTKEEDDDVEEDEEEEEEAPTPGPTPTLPRRETGGAPPPIPSNRPAPPPVPTESRPPPPPPPGGLKSATEGSESDDELSGGARDATVEAADTRAARPVPVPPQPLQSPGLPMRSPPLSPRGEEFSSASPPALPSKRASRPPPPIPGSAPVPPPSQSRPPPPPPPGGLSRRGTADVAPTPPARPVQAGEENEDEASEYEGDYDTDIASSVPHRDALKAHAREASLDDLSLQSPNEVPLNQPPPIPAAAAPRGPPPIPVHPPPEDKRRSVEAPRAVPPPPPPQQHAPGNEDYDPFNYASPGVDIPGSSFSQKAPKGEEDAYFPRQAAVQSPQSPPDRRVPPPAMGGRAPPRQSVDAQRSSTGNRRSQDQGRPSMESGFIANDLDLAVQSGWWKQANQVPPVLQGRKDIFFESRESTSNNRGAKTVITRDITVLFQDYSQTVLTARYDPYDPSDVQLEQRHEPPPRPLRQDQMEEFYERFGRPIAEAVASKKDTVVGDGSPQGLIFELLRPFSDALPPVGTRAYGALVYANMANASTQLSDVIRPGDILSIRNGRFQGKHGAMHAKYSMEVGKPDHVAVVAEWDGTKKKVRAWEQGRESKKVKVESFKLDDLRSGEVKIWRVMPRGWVGWNSQP